MTACGQDKANGTSTNKNENDVEQKSQKDEPKEEVKKEKEEPEIISIDNGEMVVIEDFAEFTITNTVFSKRIDPPSPGSFYTYYEAKEEGTTYLDTVILIKSLLTSGKSSDEFASVKVIFNEKYEYKTFSTIEDKGGSDFTFTNITSIEPLKSGTLHFLAEVPEEVEKGEEPVSVIVTVKEKDYIYKVR